MNKNDARYLHTHALIRQAFLEMLTDIGFSRITVKGLIGKAEINRSTFYSHFEDKYQLLAEIEDGLICGAVNILQDSPIQEVLYHDDSLQESLRIYYKNVSAFFRENGILLRLLLDEPNSRITSKLMAALQQQWAEQGLKIVMQIPQNYAASVFSGLIVSLATEWARSGFKETDDEFAEIAMKISCSIPLGIFHEGD